MNKGVALAVLILGGIIGLAIFAMVSVPRADPDRLPEASEASIGIAVPATNHPGYSELPNIEGDRRVYLGAMADIKQGMVMGTDKNVYVEPTIWTIV